MPLAIIEQVRIKLKYFAQSKIKNNFQIDSMVFSGIIKKI